MKNLAGTAWAVVETADGVTFRWGYSGEDVIAEWEPILSLRATRGGVLKELHPAPGASEALVEKMRTGVASAFLRARQGKQALHASAVASRGAALVCIGTSGRGKSTAAERLCRHTDVELLADDTAVLEVFPGGRGVQVIPSETSVWLLDSEASNKAPVKSCRAAAGPAALRFIVSLAFDERSKGLELRYLRGAEAVAELLPALVRFERTAENCARELDFIDEIVAHSRVVKATRPRTVTAGNVADALRSLLGASR